jgi:excisionase family DNA binding protein
MARCAECSSTATDRWRRSCLACKLSRQRLHLDEQRRRVSDRIRTSWMPDRACDDTLRRASNTVPEDTDFRTVLRRGRLLIGFTQANLAARLGVATITVRHWEAGLRRPNELTRRRLEVLLAPRAGVAGALDGTWLTCSEASRLAGVSRQAVYQAIRRGALQGRHSGSRFLVRDTDLAVWHPRTQRSSHPPRLSG